MDLSASRRDGASGSDGFLIVHELRSDHSTRESLNATGV